MRKQLSKHERFVGLGVFACQADVLVHVKGDNVFETGL